MIVVDLKTGAAAPWHALQVVAYAMAEMDNASFLLTFDPGKHRYYAGDEEVPGVSRILRKTGKQNTHTKIAEHHSIRGKFVHRAIELYCAGNLDLSSVDPTIAPYIDAFVKFMRESGALVNATEQMVFNSVYRYAGTYDLSMSLQPDDGSINAALLYLHPNRSYSWVPIKPLDYAELQSEWIQTLSEFHGQNTSDDLWA